MNQLAVRRRGKGRPRTRPGAALGDTAYSSAANRTYPRKRGIKAVIAVKEDQKNHRRRRGRAGGRPPACGAGHYKGRNTVERCFGKLKQFRAVATRYDKRGQIYQGTIDVATIRIWLRDPSMIQETGPRTGCGWPGVTAGRRRSGPAPPSACSRSWAPFSAGRRPGSGR
jgi:transposase